MVLLSWGLQSGQLSKYEVSEVESLKEILLLRLSLCLCLGDESGGSLMSSVSNKAGLILLLDFMCIMLYICQHMCG